MKRRVQIHVFRSTIAVAVLLAAAVLGTDVAAATHGDSGGPPRDFAVGGGRSGGDASTIRAGFAAQNRGPDPSDPASGHFRASGALVDAGFPEVGDATAFKFEGPVTCLNVSGREATLYYEFKNAEPPEFEGGGILVFLEDNGNPASGDPPDRFGFVGPVAGGGGVEVPGPTTCPPPTGAPKVVPLDEGNITVHDATP